MKRKRFSVEQIVAVLTQAEVVPAAELIRQVGISEQTRVTSLAPFALCDVKLNSHFMEDQPACCGM